jgi:hypothetical protein
MKQSKLNEVRPTRSDLIAYLAERDRNRPASPTGGKTSRFSPRKPADAPVCASI